MTQGENYPNFASADAHFNCDRKLVGGTEIRYQSRAGFHGTNSFTVSSPDSAESASFVIGSLKIVRLA